MSEEAVTTEEVVEEATETTTEATETVETIEKVETTEEKAFVDSMLDAMTDEEVKGHKMWENLKGKDADELGRYVKELKSFAGKKGDIPKPDASEDEWNEFYQKLGVPESKDEYDFAMNDEFKELVGESAPFYEQALDWFKEAALGGRMKPEDADKLVDGYFDLVAGQTKEAQKALDALNSANEETLRNEWGDAYDGIYGGVKALLKSNGMTDEDISKAEAAGVLKEPGLAITLGKIAAKLEDDPEIGHHQTRTVSGLHDQLNEINSQVGQYIEKGESVPKHLQQKRMDLMNKLGENL